MRRAIIVTAGILLIVGIAGCADPNATVHGAAGFWTGLWDGITADFAFIGNLFGGHYGIYEVPNSGGWYDLGFLLGIGAFNGGGVAGASR